MDVIGLFIDDVIGNKTRCPERNRYRNQMLKTTDLSTFATLRGVILVSTSTMYGLKLTNGAHCVSHLDVIK